MRPGSGWAPGMGCSGVLFHPRSTVAAGVGTGLLRSQRSAPPNDAGLAGEASRRRYAEALYEDEGATLDELREAVTTLEDAGRRARRVLGGTHPHTVDMEQSLRDALATLRARETAAA